MSDGGRELDLYGPEPPPERVAPPAAPASAPAPQLLDLYEGVEAAQLGARLAERPRQPQPAATGPREAEGAAEKSSPDWFEALWGLFPASIRERYKPHGVIGEGGMGIVIEAHDCHMDRTVAIKGLRDPAGLTSNQRARQAEEARLTARLPHPNIMPVYDLWRDAQGNSWCSMMRVPNENPTLARHLEELANCVRIEERPLSRLLGIFLEICRAIAHAHENGVIHRDLKPENIFVGPAGEALVADWGVALDLRAPSPSSAALVGTPGYSAPEQLGAFGKPWSDVRSDIYGLGMILFEMVVARRATQASTADSNRVVGLEAQPQKVQVPDRVPRELKAIIEKAASREPAERHASVEALMREVEIYLNGGLLEGIRYSRRERLRRWIKANPGKFSAAVALAVVAALVSAQVASVNSLMQREAREQARLLQQARYEQAQLYAQKAEAAELAHSPDQALHYSALALATCPPGRVLPTPAAYSLAAGSRSLGRLLWTHRMNSVSYSVAFHPDGRRAAVGGADGVVHLFDVSTGRELAQLTGHKGWVECVAFDPAGRILASAGEDGAIRFWSVDESRPLLKLEGHPAAVQNLVFCGPDGKRLLTSGEDGTIRLWDTISGKELWRRQQVLAGPQALKVHPQGRRMMLGLSDSSGELWDIDAGEIRNRISDSSRPVRQLAFSPDGSTLAFTGTLRDEASKVTLWDLDLWKEVGTLEGHTAAVTALAFSADGRSLITGSDDMTIRVWPLDARKACLRLDGHTDAITALAPSPDGRLLLSVGQDSTVRLWHISRREAVEASEALGGTPTCLTFHPDSQSLAGADPGRRVHVWDVASGCEVVQTPAEHGDVQDLAFSRDGSELVYRTTSGDTVWWQLAKRREERRVRGEHSRLSSLVRLKGGKLLAATARRDTGELIDLEGSRTVLTIPSGLSGCTGLSVSPDGRVLAAIDSGTSISLRDVKTGAETARLESPVGGLDRVEFSPDGRWLVRAGGDRRLALWDLASSAPTPSELTGHASRVLSFAFAPGGRRLASGSKDGEILLWDLADGKFTARLKASEQGVAALAFSPDGRWLVSAGYDAWLRVWDVGRLEAPQALLKEVESSSPFSLTGTELLVDGRVVRSRVRFPEDHPFHWLEAAAAGDVRAALRAGLTMRGAWRPDEDLPRGWGREAARWLSRAGLAETTGVK